MTANTYSRPVAGGPDRPLSEGRTFDYCEDANAYLPGAGYIGRLGPASFENGVFFSGLVAPTGMREAPCVPNWKRISASNWHRCRNNVGRHQLLLGRVPHRGWDDSIHLPAKFR